MPGRLQDKIAIVTGAARGIGAAIAHRFACEGAGVAALDVAETAPQAAAPDHRPHPNIRSWRCDVTDRRMVEGIVADIAETLGEPDVLVNNAGIVLNGSVEEMAEDDWDRIFAVNVKSVYLLSRSVIPLMRAKGGGSIVNVASESAFIGFPMHHAYCATKAAVVHLGRSMATRYAADRIRVNALCPGTIDTGMYRHFLSQQSDPSAVDRQIRDMHPLGLGTVDDIAWAAVYLASDESKYTTGAPMLVDGGSTAL
ncbi:SDR family NAD(P)-dependent oxidoreductase [Taklimakanibacter lacteus]|uniref:SDR family NAD(P)-dependent oxidoreductase n=1 Tax=Taklimakanibacter lacteus TaxID=2268456 RepID=UPI000E675A60